MIHRRKYTIGICFLESYQKDAKHTEKKHAKSFLETNWIRQGKTQTKKKIQKDIRQFT